MDLPFTTKQFLAVIEAYNKGVWPMQIVLVLAGIIVVFLALKGKPKSNTIILFLLAFLWLWMGIVYHLFYFTTINNAAYLFGSTFIIEGILFMYLAIFKKDVLIQFQYDIKGIIGHVLILFSMIIYPILGYLQGHLYPAFPTFGLPCPTTILTFGILLWFRKYTPVSLLIIPFTWSLVGFSAAFFLGIKEDVGLLISGVLATTIILVKKK